MTESPELISTRVGRYDVVSVLGRGGMGVVYDAVDSDLGRHVALKVLPAALAADPGRLGRFVKEARAASALNHPNVVSIYEIGQDRVGDADVHYIAMEKVEGQTLRGVLAGTRLPLARSVDLVAQVADAIAAAHAAGIVHRDLKPENIVLSSHGAPKVLDFGLAKLRPVDGSGRFDSETALRSTDSGVILGTVGYMAPEQAQGKAADHRSDIFSLGCILYEALSGRRAFAAGSAVETLNAVINADPPPLRGSNPDVSAELQRIVGKTMSKQPDERYQSAKEMAIDLRAALRAEPSRGGTARWTRYAVAGLVAAVAIVAAIALWPRLRPQAAQRQAQPAATLNVRRVTSFGTVTHAAISPDGKFLVYSMPGRGIRLRQLATGEDIDLVSPGPTWGLTFTPDGNSVLYVSKDPQDPIGSCFRIAAIGGRPEHLFDGIDSAPSVSRDGKRLTWSRVGYPKRGQSAVMVADADGSNPRVLAVKSAPDQFAPLFFAGPAWSPDGTKIVTPVRRDAQPVGSKLYLLDAETGQETALMKRPWPVVSQADWLPDGSGIVVVASSEEFDNTGLRLWHFPLAGGMPRRITSESAYRGLSLTGRGDKLVSLTLEISGQVWRVPLAGDGTARKVSDGKTDGWRGMAALPDGRLVFSSLEEPVQTLAISNADGSGRRRLTRDANANTAPVAFAGGIAYVSVTPERTEICVTSFEGDGRRVLVRDVDASPIAVSPDGTWLVFRRDRRLWKMPMAGGTPVELLTEIASIPVFSPDGERIALLLGDTEMYSGRAAVISAKDSRLLWSAPLSGVRLGTIIRWHPGGDGLLINAAQNDDRNLWYYPFEGKPEQVTRFEDLRSYFWDLSPDGRFALMARANITRDAVLVTGFR